MGKLKLEILIDESTVSLKAEFNPMSTTASNLAYPATNSVSGLTVADEAFLRSIDLPTDQVLNDANDVMLQQLDDAVDSFPGLELVECIPS